MVRTVIRLGPGECSNVETGARYFAALAYPGAGEEIEREQVTAAKAAQYLHEANRVDECTHPFEDPRLNELVSLDPQWCRARVRTMDRRLADRAEVARAVRPWMREALEDGHHQVPGIKKFTQRQIALFLNDNDVVKADNFQKRVWRPSRPVLHMAIAQDLGLSLLGVETGVDLDLASMKVIGGMVQLALKLVPRLCSDRRFGVSEANLLMLEWIS